MTDNTVYKYLHLNSKLVHSKKSADYNKAEIHLHSHNLKNVNRVCVNNFKFQIQCSILPTLIDS